jgi:hypothetical protein
MPSSPHISAARAGSIGGFPSFRHNEAVRYGRIFFFLLFSFVVALPSTLQAKAKHTPLPSSTSTTTISRDYVSALGAADRFLHAWQSEDREGGLLLLSDAAKAQSSETKLERFFSPEDSVPRSFQIAHGKKLRAGRYIFPVSLLEIAGKTTRVRSSQLVVAQTSGSDWVVDKLP